jgi:hypothetical protein
MPGEQDVEPITVLTVDPGRSVYALINAVQELAAQNAVLAARIEALESAR